MDRHSSTWTNETHRNHFVVLIYFVKINPGSSGGRTWRLSAHRSYSNNHTISSLRQAARCSAPLQPQAIGAQPSAYRIYIFHSIFCMLSTTSSGLGCASLHCQSTQHHINGLGSSCVYPIQSNPPVQHGQLPSKIARRSEYPMFDRASRNISLLLRP